MIELSALGFGSAPIGNLYTAIDDEAAAAAVDAAWDNGIRYFDTAPHYGLGLAERRLGHGLGGRPRNDFVVSTKVGRLLVDNPKPTGSDLESGGFAVDDELTRIWDFSADGVRRSIDGSLRRLGLDRVDIVYLHDPDDHIDVALRDAIPALIELRDQHVVSAIGVGMNFVEPLRRFVDEADIDVIMLAGRWTLADRTAETLVATCADRGIVVVDAAPFNSGLLAKPWPADDVRFDYEPASVEMLARARQLAKVCQHHGFTLPQAALQFPLRHPSVGSVVAGMRTAEQVRQCAGWMTTSLPEELWAELG